ncbi:flagellar hook-length control protein FliK [Yoonia sp.]|uniref:flagellar hook-length control protein FliK n=1 Tax=Yoonia sp. TaxID=2212373 RepID=UPI00391A9B01
MLTLAWTNERPGPEIQARAEVLGHDPVQHKIVPDAKSHPVQVPEHADIPMKHRPVAVPQPSAATVVSVSAIAPSHGVSDRTPLPLEKIGPAAAASQTTDMSARGDLSTQPAPYGSPERQMIAVPAAEKDDVAARFEALRADRAVPVPTVIAQPKRAVNVAEPVGALTPPLVLQDSKTAMNVLADQDDILIGISPERGQTGQPSALSAQATPDMPRQIAKQLAVAITQHPGRSTEIALNPVELGRVRMNIAAHDGALSLHIMVERPETTDLMRRHIETLTEEFHALGYSDVTFSFSDERSPDPEGDTPAPQQQHFDSRPPPEVSAPIIAVDRRKSGLDLRL